MNRRPRHRCHHAVQFANRHAFPDAPGASYYTYRKRLESPQNACSPALRHWAAALYLLLPGRSASVSVVLGTAVAARFVAAACAAAHVVFVAVFAAAVLAAAVASVAIPAIAAHAALSHAVALALATDVPEALAEIGAATATVVADAVHFLVRAADAVSPAAVARATAVSAPVLDPPATAVAVAGYSLCRGCLLWLSVARLSSVPASKLDLG